MRAAYRPGRGRLACSPSRILRRTTPHPAPIWNSWPKRSVWRWPTQRLRDVAGKALGSTRSPACVIVIIWKIPCKPKRHRQVRTGEPLSCMMIDIDHFKSINDRFGHEAGDQVIKSVASIVQRAAHDNGLAFRYGGEEFLVLLPRPMNQRRTPARRRFTPAYMSCRFATG